MPNVQHEECMTRCASMAHPGQCLYVPVEVPWAHQMPLFMQVLSINNLTVQAVDAAGQGSSRGSGRGTGTPADPSHAAIQVCKCREGWILRQLLP